MVVAPLEVCRQNAGVLAHRLVQAVEEFSTRTGESYASIGRRTGLSRGYIDKMRAAVTANPEHRIDTRTLERIADAIGYEVNLTPKSGGNQ